MPRDLKIGIIVLFGFLIFTGLFAWQFTRYVSTELTLTDAHGQLLPSVPGLQIRLWSGQEHSINISNTNFIGTLQLKRGRKYNLVVWFSEKQGDEHADYEEIINRKDVHLLYSSHITADGFQKEVHVKLDKVTQKNIIRIGFIGQPIPDNEVVVERYQDTLPH